MAKETIVPAMNASKFWEILGQIANGYLDREDAENFMKELAEKLPKASSGGAMRKPDEIVLALNQNANSGECGSCHYFARRDANSEWDQNGHCTFRFPPTREFVKTAWDGESLPLDTVQDTNGCDFWKSSGKTYIVSQRIKP